MPNQQNHSEAPTSFHFKNLITPGGNQVSLTIRDFAEARQEVEKLLEFELWLMSLGFRASEQHNDDGTISFAAKELIGREEDNGRVYWRVKGDPPRHQFGVRVWEETLEQAGFDPNIPARIDIDGYAAICELRPKQDGDGTKEVVVELRQGGGAAKPVSASPAPESKPVPQPTNGKRRPPAATVGQTAGQPKAISNPAELTAEAKRRGAAVQTPADVYKALGGWPDFSNAGAVEDALLAVVGK